MSIEIRNIEKHFGNFHALRDVSLHIASGELVALLGPSGCGKTTLLRIIAGLETPDHGSIWFSGADTTDVHVRSRNVGFVFQHYALFRHMSVFDNVAFGLRMKPRATRPSAAQIREKVHTLLELVQLDWLAERYPAQLSGGQRQRIALARALAVEPQVLLLDEPFGALDAKVRKELRRWLRRLHDELHVTSIFVTHDQAEALEVADRVVLMHEGTVQQIGAPQEVWEHPSSPFVYGFLGDVNVLHGRVHQGWWRTGSVEGDAADNALRLHVPEHAQVQDTPALAYVRPHEIHLQRPGNAHTAPTDGGASSAPGAHPQQQGLAAQVLRAHVVGPLARLEFALLSPGIADAKTPLEVHLNAQELEQHAYRVGETLLLTPRGARVFLA